MRVTWWGHSTVGIEESGVRLLTDPVLGMRVAHLRRRRGPRPAVPGPDAVLVSHLHADHLHLGSIRLLPPTTRLIVPAGAAAFIGRRLGPAAAARCVELRAGQETDINGVRVTAVPAAHDGSRGPWSRHRAPALGYLVHGTSTTWFAGDTGLFDGMAGLGPVDLALIPVGGWGPTLGDGHLGPREAAEAVRRCGATWAVPVHYGTLWPVGCERMRPDLFHSPGTDFARHAGQIVPQTQVRVLAPGESLTLDATTGRAP
ncbi:MBL fold metallo-hydrolase [Rhizomonospora bruguierae]|uniref:MBL fold metallo-hydrolase n=1 Tax=Rhizomonospora bruguierae TaxID=1581705 RepID=UPI001BCDA5E4|nr:MBL fold metallo-hydrolase [Micromonospora sp. NBRC 107566]